MKIKLQFLSVFIIFLSLSSKVQAQSFLSLSTGISTDLNNPNHNFYHIPFTLQWKPSARKRAPFFLEFNYNIPFTSKSTGDAYTLNPSLPEKVTLQENIKPAIFTMNIGFRIHLYTNKKSNSFYLNLLPFGICIQNFSIDYKNYDKQNYEVLNPDVNLNSGGIVESIEAAYFFHKTKQDMVIMLHLQTPPLKSRGDYPLSYKFVAPLQLTFGYNLFYNKRK